MSDDIASLSLVDVAAAIASRELSSVEVTRACLARIERLQPVLNCFITLEAEDALAAARAADEALARGEKLGPLHGVPLAHKDMFYRAGHRCTGGSKIRRDFVPDVTATVQTRLAAAGALCLGGLNMSEFAVGPTGHNIHYGACRNPWNPAHAPGGSSSGSGAAVAARLVYGALGSDTGGSIRIPAALCGLVGLKPSHGRISRHGGVSLSFSLDCFGPLTRTVHDGARLTRLLAGHDPADPSSSREPVEDYEQACYRGIQGLKIGVPADHGGVEVAPDVTTAVTDGLALLENQGADIVEVALPDQAQMNALSTIVTRAEGATIHRKWLTERRDDYSPQVRRRMEMGLLLPATRYLEALSLRARFLEAFATDVFGRCDVLLLPTVPMPAPTLAELDVGDSDALPAMLQRLTGFTRPMNYLGLPALSVPAGFSADGLPLGFQLVGRPFAEATLFAAGAAYQRATTWHERAPDMAAVEETV